MYQYRMGNFQLPKLAHIAQEVCKFPNCFTLVCLYVQVLSSKLPLSGELHKAPFGVT